MANNKDIYIELANRIYDLDGEVYKCVGSSLGRTFTERCYIRSVDTDVPFHSPIYNCHKKMPPCKGGIGSAMITYCCSRTSGLRRRRRSCSQTGKKSGTRRSRRSRRSWSGHE